MKLEQENENGEEWNSFDILTQSLVFTENLLLWKRGFFYKWPTYCVGNVEQYHKHSVETSTIIKHSVETRTIIKYDQNQYPAKYRSSLKIKHNLSKDDMVDFFSAGQYNENCIWNMCKLVMGKRDITEIWDHVKSPAINDGISPGFRCIIFSNSPLYRF